jgi:hypothetical protein
MKNDPTTMSTGGIKTRQGASHFLGAFAVIDSAFCPHGAPSSSSARCSGSRSRPGRAGAQRSFKSVAGASNFYNVRAHLIFGGLCGDRVGFCPNGAPSSSLARCSGSRSRPGRAGARRSFQSVAGASNGTARCLKTEMRPAKKKLARVTQSPRSPTHRTQSGVALTTSLAQKPPNLSNPAWFVNSALERGITADFWAV